MQSQRLTLVRLRKQEISLINEPLNNALVVRDGLLNFHFCLFDLQGPYKGGFYHGVLELHENYPFMAPKLIFYTPNGRFETNIPICTSFTSYHQQSWTSAWNVRTLILATISFMYSEEPSYGCKNDTEEQRKEYAKNSLTKNRNNDKFIQLFGEKLISLGIITCTDIKQQLQYAKQRETEKQTLKNNETTCWQKLCMLGSVALIVLYTVFHM